MENSIYSATLGSIVEQRRLEILANDLANIATPGFKADRLLNRSQVEYISDPHVSKQRREFRSILQKLSSQTSFEQGPIKQTGHNLDFALHGPGFFAVQTPGGISYTRAGNFSLDVEGTLVTPEGFAVLGESGPIQLESADFVITPDGTVIDGGTEVDRLQLVEFERPEQLVKIGSTLFNAPKEAKPKPSENTKVNQGYLEQANANMIKLLAEMLHSQRSFETYQRIIKMSDQLQHSLATKMIGGR